ncbi:T9SS type A sorting domain-containing protein [Aureibacter tunicatorum]|uniref:Secretion system C-terminal sorting domain-containing protein n=1 Tax=Aureibacter tunicatorum TaxID=866807 RepID=A0AAE3XK24_9BACT|nr:T9SS type A sorting domain-containing protein [Aureibacter tunicatorum]MDR6237428.1 hypothetical protein [Aureibacter tunicatorum]BDD06418.1 hypothetical protein AUTU_39010 [Aureibacter tunicatorum]
MQVKDYRNILLQWCRIVTFVFFQCCILSALAGGNSNDNDPVPPPIILKVGDFNNDGDFDLYTTESSVTGYELYDNNDNKVEYVLGNNGNSLSVIIEGENYNKFSIEPNSALPADQFVNEGNYFQNGNQVIYLVNDTEAPVVETIYYDDTEITSPASVSVVNNQAIFNIKFDEPVKGSVYNDFNINNGGQIESVKIKVGNDYNVVNSQNKNDYKDNYYSEFQLTIDFTQNASFDISVASDQLKDQFNNKNDSDFTLFSVTVTDYDDAAPVLQQAQLGEAIITLGNTYNLNLINNKAIFYFTFDEPVKGDVYNDFEVDNGGSINEVSVKVDNDYTPVTNQNKDSFEDNYYSEFKIEVDFTKADAFALSVKNEKLIDQYGNKNDADYILLNVDVANYDADSPSLDDMSQAFSYQNGVMNSTTVKFIFSEEMNSSTLGNIEFDVDGSKYSSDSWTYGNDNDGNTFDYDYTITHAGAYTGNIGYVIKSGTEVTDLAGNAISSLGSTTLYYDNVAPVLQSIESDYDVASATGTFILTFSEEVHFPNDVFSISPLDGILVTGPEKIDNVNKYKYTLTSGTFSGSQLVDLSYAVDKSLSDIKDYVNSEGANGAVEGNNIVKQMSLRFDNERPTLESIEHNYSSASKESTITLIFSEEMDLQSVINGFNISDLTDLSKASPSQGVEDNGRYNYTFTISQDNQGDEISRLLAVAEVGNGAKILDVEGNEFELKDGFQYPNNIVFDSQRPNLAQTAGKSLSYVNTNLSREVIIPVSFGENVNNINAADFSVNNGLTIENVEKNNEIGSSDGDYFVTVKMNSYFEGVFNLSLDNSHNIQDDQGNLAQGQINNIPFDNQGPSITTAGYNVNGDKLVITINFNETVASFGLDDIVLRDGNDNPVTVFSKSGLDLSNNPVVTFELSVIDGKEYNGGDLQILIVQNSMKDDEGNFNEDISYTINNINFETVNPSIESYTVHDIVPNTDQPGSSSFTIVFSESVKGLSVDDFSYNNTDLNLAIDVNNENTLVNEVKVTLSPKVNTEKIYEISFNNSHNIVDDQGNALEVPVQSVIYPFDILVDNFTQAPDGVSLEYIGTSTSLPFSFNNDNKYYTNNDFDITLNFEEEIINADFPSGLSPELGGSNVVISNSSKRVKYEVDALVDGEKSFTLSREDLKDSIGNWLASPITYTIVLDKTSPTLDVDNMSVSGDIKGPRIISNIDFSEVLANTPNTNDFTLVDENDQTIYLAKSYDTQNKTLTVSEGNGVEFEGKLRLKLVSNNDLEDFSGNTSENEQENGTDKYFEFDFDNKVPEFSISDFTIIPSEDQTSGSYRFTVTLDDLSLVGYTFSYKITHSETSEILVQEITGNFDETPKQFEGVIDELKSGLIRLEFTLVDQNNNSETKTSSDKNIEFSLGIKEHENWEARSRDIYFCSGDNQLTLVARASGAEDGDYTYKWKIDNNNEEVTKDSLFVVDSDASRILISVFSGTSQLLSESYTLISVDPPTFNFKQLEPLELNCGTSRSITINPELNFSEKYSWIWEDQNGVPIEGSDTQTNLVVEELTDNVDKIDIFTIKAQNLSYSSCVGELEVEVKKNTIIPNDPLLDAGSVSLTCENQSSILQVSNIQSDVSYKWMKGEEEQAISKGSFEVTEDGEYSVIAIDDVSFCESKNIASTNISSDNTLPEEVTFEEGKGDFINKYCQGNEIVGISPNIVEGHSYTWYSDKNGTTINDQSSLGIADIAELLNEDNLEVVYDKPTSSPVNIYIQATRDANGCKSDYLSVQLTVSEKDSISISDVIFSPDYICAYGEEIKLEFNHEFESIVFEDATNPNDKKELISEGIFGNRLTYTIEEGSVVEVNSIDRNGCSYYPFQVLSPTVGEEAISVEGEYITIPFSPASESNALSDNFFEELFNDTGRGIELFKDSYVSNMLIWVNESYRSNEYDIDFSKTQGVSFNEGIQEFEMPKTVDFSSESTFTFDFTLTQTSGDKQCEFDFSIDKNIVNGVGSDSVFNFEDHASEKLELKEFLLCIPTSEVLRLSPVGDSDFTNFEIEVNNELLTSSQLQEYINDNLADGEPSYTVNAVDLRKDKFIRDLDFIVSATKNEIIDNNPVEIAYSFKVNKSFAEIQYPELSPSVIQDSYCRGIDAQIDLTDLGLMTDEKYSYFDDGTEILFYKNDDSNQEVDWLSSDDHVTINTNISESNQDITLDYLFKAIDPQGCRLEMLNSVQINKIPETPNFIGQFAHCTGNEDAYFEIENPQTVDQTTYNWYKISDLNDQGIELAVNRVNYTLPGIHLLETGDYFIKVRAERLGCYDSVSNQIVLVKRPELLVNLEDADPTDDIQICFDNINNHEITFGLKNESETLSLNADLVDITGNHLGQDYASLIQKSIDGILLYPTIHVDNIIFGFTHSYSLPGYEGIESEKGCLIEGELPFTVLPAIEAEIDDLIADGYCQNTDVELKLKTLAKYQGATSYSFVAEKDSFNIRNNAGDIETVPVIDNKFIYDSPSSGTFKVLYGLVDKYGCNFSDSTDLIINPLPNPSFGITDGFCEGEFANFALTGISNEVEPFSYVLNFGDLNLEKFENQSKDSNIIGVSNTEGTYANPLHLYRFDGNKVKEFSNISLSVTNQFGCVADSTLEKQVFKAFPTATISHMGTVEGMESYLSDDVVESIKVNWEWRVDDDLISNNQITSLSTIALNGISAGVHNVDLKVSTEGPECVSYFDKKIAFYPVKSPTDDVAYIEDFETSSAEDWINSGDLGLNDSSSWKLGLPEGVDTLRFANSGNNAWSTSDGAKVANNISYNESESSSVSSPWFDLCEITQPMLAIRVWTDLAKDLEGAVLQYRYAQEESSWLVLGDVGTGVNWYNSTGIVSDPGEQSGKNVGWSTDSQKEWLDAKQQLDDIQKLACDQEDLVQFRIAFASSTSAIQSGIFDGFAFDDFRIFERNRVLLVENFLSEEIEVSPALNVAGADNSSITINYLNFSNNANARRSSSNVDESARALMYKVNEGGKTILDGSQELTETNYAQRKLKEVILDINATVKVNANILEISVDALKKADLSDESGGIILHTAIVMPNEVIQGATYENTLKAMLPDAAGTRLTSEWINSTEVTNFSQSYSWKADEAAQYDSMHIVVFAQNELTNDVYQVKKVTLKSLRFDVVKGMEEMVNEGVKAYPVPASEILNVEWDAKGAIWDCSLYDTNGKLHLIKTASQHQEKISLDVSGLSSGVYFLRFASSDNRTEIIKVIID